jgi:hypothetical protein
LQQLLYRLNQYQSTPTYCDRLQFLVGNELIDLGSTKTSQVARVIDASRDGLCSVAAMWSLLVIGLTDTVHARSPIATLVSE